MEYIYDSDLLKCGTQIIAQQCNCVTKTAKGLSKTISDAYEHANFYDRASPSTPGTIEVRGGKGKQWVLAMYAQYHPGGASEKNGDTKEQRLVWFEACLEKIKKIKNMRVIAFPHNIGCGLAKGDWDQYHALLEKFAEDVLFRVILVNKNSEPPKLVKKDLTLLEHSREHTPKGWEDFFESALEISLPEISEFLEAETEEVYPKICDVYKVFDIVEPSQIKVVIIGQDPYHDQDQAMGIAFSVPEGITPPPSLRNIYKELESSGFTIGNKKNGDLSSWCEKGVFLVNTALTVRAHTPKSHSKLWTQVFTPNLLSWLDEECEPLVVILWGKDAQNMGEVFGPRHRKIKSVHPSPLSASKGFFGSDPFNKANTYLEELGRDPVDWSL